MKSFSRRSKCTGLVVILIVSQFILPIAGGPLTALFSKNQGNLEQTSAYFNINDPIAKDLLNQDETRDLESSVFDSGLQKYLNNFSKKGIQNEERVKVLIEFDKNIPKQTRVDKINSIFNNFKILNNYDIIQTVFLEIDIFELIEKETQLKEEQAIIKIYKSKTYKTPVITDSAIETGNLNSDNYPNWWVPAVGAENLPYDGSGVSVAIVDTGINDHPDLTVIAEEDFVGIDNYRDYYGHGTHAAGIVASSGISSGGEYRGIAPQASLINAKAGNLTKGLSEGDIIEAIQWASKPTDSDGAGADIISMSFGANIFQASQSIWNAISNAAETYGTIFVGSAGNSGQNFYTGGTPATHPNVISVGATNKNNRLASFSSCGPSLSYIGFPDVVAPGVDIISTSAQDSILEKQKKYVGDFFDFSGNGDYIPLSGTSMSCPAVAGAIAVLKDAFPNISAETARIALYEGAYKISEPEEAYITRSGAGIINVSASIDFLTEINSTQDNINNLTYAFPSDLPVEPFDLLNFPGDSQSFNLTIASGMNNTIGFELPTDIDGIKVSLARDNLVYNQGGINFTTLDIEIDQNATLGRREFLINLTINGQRINYTNIKVSFNVRFPEQRVLLESYHGLNDWLEEELSYPQIGFYEAMADLRDLNISVDYLMEYWVKDYNLSTDNFILTKERLAQYDLIILQNPILPYSPLEIDNLVDYYNNGGHILYLGKRYQHVCSDNLNVLFSELGINSQIKEQNIISDENVGIGSLINYIAANPQSSLIFDGVEKFLWGYGHTFNITGDTESIAEIDDETVAVAYNGSTSNKGQFIGFGDLTWLYYDYSEKSEYYAQNHTKLLTNMMNYFFESEQVALDISLNSERINSGDLNISLYAKNTTSDQLINSSVLNSNLSVSISNSSSYLEMIEFNSLENGIAINYSYSLPHPSIEPYEITVNLTLGSTIYSKKSKVLYYDSSSIPDIKSLDTNISSVNKGGTIDLEANMDSSGYDDFNAYISLYSDGFFNTEKTVNQTEELSNDTTSKYDSTFTLPTDPSGVGIFYVIPRNNNYTTPNSPRHTFDIINQAPEISKSSSFIGSKPFSDTIEGNNLLAQFATQGDSISLTVDAEDQGSFEDDKSQLSVTVNFFMVAVSEETGEGSALVILFPSTFIYKNLNYNTDSDKHVGSISIPYSMEFGSIKGDISVSTESSSNQNDINYLSILYINVLDSEGTQVKDPFYILYYIYPASEPIPWELIIIGLLVIAGLIGVGILVYAFRRDKIYPEGKGDYDTEPTLSSEWKDRQTYNAQQRSFEAKADSLYHCLFCGRKIETPKRYCPGCGKAIEM